MQLTAELLNRIAVGKPNASNVKSIVLSFNQSAAVYGIDQPHRLAHCLCQLAHESGSFRYDKEIASGAAYEGRKDLGNTQRGDGKRFKGRGPIQVTGRANYTAFTKWCRKIDPDAPDFVKEPELINTDPWEGMTVIWYWDEGNPDPKERSLNYYADRNDIEMVTRRINGGLNGFEDRIRFYDRTAMILLGYSTPSWKPVKRDQALIAFQAEARKRGDYKPEPDGVSGPQTRAALHMALTRLSRKTELSDDVAKSPVVVVEEKKVEVKVPDPVAVPVVTEDLEKPWYKDLLGQKEIVTGVIGTGAPAAFGAPWQTVAVIGAVLLTAGVAFYIIRGRKAKEQQAMVRQIDMSNAGNAAGV